MKERKALRNASKLTVEGTEAVTEEASVVSEIDKLDDAMENLKKWKKSDVVELKITKTGETGKIGESGSNSSIVIDAGKTVGTKGENLVKIVILSDGGMLSAYPIK